MPEPEVEQVREGIHRIPLPLPNDSLRSVNVYAVCDGAGVALIDAGWALDEAYDQLERALAVLGQGFDGVTRMLITHMHRDHYTLAVRVRRRFGTRIEVGLGERPSLERLARGEYSRQRSSITWWGAQDLTPELDAEADAAPEDYELPSAWIDAPTVLMLGERRLQVIPTPGHTRGHLVFADTAAGVLFAGDHLLPHITPSIGVETVSAAQPLRDFLNSLDVMAALPDLEVLPGHGPMGSRSHVRAKELTAHHDRRLRVMLAAVRAGGSTAYHVARAVPWTHREQPFAELGVRHRLLAVGEAAAHLELLRSDGYLLSRDDGGVRYYHRDATEE